MLRLFNTRTRKVEAVQPIEPNRVKMYTCGPTVYRDAHIGNLRSYLMADWVRRALRVRDIDVVHIKNITDVGHMRQEMVEQGEDKVLAAALQAGKTPQDIARLYAERFFEDERKLNILPATRFPSATEHIPEMIEIVAGLLDKRMAYEVDGNVYFAVSSFPAYGALSGNTERKALLEAVRVDADPRKRDSRDFTLWKAAEPGRDLKWPSPWGEGFPGWHIECSAMSMKYLGDRFDIHTGGVDNIFPHHEGEIAQSEGFVGHEVVNLWLHGQHLLADGAKMSKSVGNSFTLASLVERDFDPLSFRYLCATVRYSSRLNFTFTALKAAERALRRLRDMVWMWAQAAGGVAEESLILQWWDKFLDRAEDDLDFPGAMAVVWKAAHSDMSPATKLELVRKFDMVLGLDLTSDAVDFRLPKSVATALASRESLRSQHQFQRADAMRSELDRGGYIVRDGRAGTQVRPKTPFERREGEGRTVSSSAEVHSRIGEPNGPDFSIVIVACNHKDDVRRCIGSALRYGNGFSTEVVVVDNGSTDGASEILDQVEKDDASVTVVHTDHVLGEGAARNIGLKRATGAVVVLLDTSAELTGDVFTPLKAILEDRTVGVAGPLGLRTGDLHHFHDGEGESGDVDAMQAYCFAFRRDLLADVGLMRESFRFYRNLDLDYSFHFKERGYRIVADPGLPVRIHQHRVWTELGVAEREELSKKNFRRFLDKWGGRTDLLVEPGGDHHH